MFSRLWNESCQVGAQLARILSWKTSLKRAHWSMETLLCILV